MPEDPDVVSRRLARESLDRDDATGWFEDLYAAAADGEAVVPWDRGTAHQLLVDWIDESQPDGTGKTAVVVGAGTGWDAELVADRGYDTTAFDISPSAIETAHRNHPGSRAHYLVADLLNPPADWHQAFDLVVEIYTVQALPRPLQPTAIHQVTSLVAPGGTLLVIAAAAPDAAAAPSDTPTSDADPQSGEPQGPPWPLTRATIQSFTTPDLHLIQLDRAPSPTTPSILRWRAEYLRD
ncbi:class I SAM-dependent methyltransferase [Kribbella solani]|uniref:class I SAM-dependent methyltransferase n=2 Tax=Kribbella solani TaxID=236067 RepID=UPI0029B4FA14|nr:class I SAM-dependent methyltransferase [Kribbella solani]MDX3005174.1 class I SAM-dependent methyltransferase [Kribbella solani]